MSSSKTVLNRVAAIVGVGPGLGASLAKRFASEGYKVALIARNQQHLDPVEKDIKSINGTVLSIQADAGNEESLRSAFARIRSEFANSLISVLCYNAGAFKQGGILDIKPSDMSNLLNVGVIGALTSAQEVLPAMVEAKEGTILLTGATASLRGGNKFAGLSVPKFALRSLAQSMAREFGPQNIHVAHVIIDGGIDLERTMAMQPNRPKDSFLSAESIAETYWNIHKQNHSAWTHELDLRPYVEKW